MTERKQEIWLLDDDESIRFVLEAYLKKEGYTVRSFELLERARHALDSAQPDLLITDIRLPDGNGTDLLSHAQVRDHEVPVLVTTAFSDLNQAVSAYQEGAFEYLSKPFDLDQVRLIVEKACADTAAQAEQPAQHPREAIVGESPAMQEVFRTIGRLSRSEISVLLTGETGTGKEIVARALHRHSPRAQGPFIAINTAAIPSELLESELFGHEKGAFTGALNRHPGRFQEAQGGTLFLDEIGDMPLALQTRLLRVLAEGDYYRVGGRDLLRADVRVIAATHQNLEKKVSDGSFREDLFHRLNVINLHLPPLRARSEDIPQLCEVFLDQAADEMALERKQIHPDALALLKTADWPGNVRQLRNLCQQLTVMAAGDVILPGDLAAEFQPTGLADTAKGGWEQQLLSWATARIADGDEGLLKTATHRFQRTLITAALRETHGQINSAATLLGWSRNTLTRKIAELELESLVAATRKAGK